MYKKDIMYKDREEIPYLCIMSKTPKNKDTICRIYVLLCPDTLEVRYIGKTVKSLHDRLVGHLYSSKVESNHRTNWIKSLQNQGKVPLITQLDECPWSESQASEQYWIKWYKEKGANLVNQTLGGEGHLGRSPSRENIEKLIKIHSIPVCQYDLNGELLQCYSSIQEAARTTSSSASKIVACCKGRRYKHNKSIWKYEKEISIL